MISILIFIKIIFLISCATRIIPFKNNLNIPYQNDKEYMTIVESNIFQTDLYIGKPIQKINNIGFIISYENSLNKLFIKSSKFNNGYDVTKSKSIKNYTYERDIDNKLFIEYGFFNDTVYFGNKILKGENHESFINIIQLNQNNLYFPVNGFVFEYSNFVNFEYFDSDKGVVILYDDYPHKYDLRYKEEDLEELLPDYVQFENNKINDIKEYIISNGNFISINYMYAKYFNSLSQCGKIYLDDGYYFKCDKNSYISNLKIRLGNLVFDENDLVLKFDNYKIPLIKFVDSYLNQIDFGGLYTKKYNVLKPNYPGFDLKRYKKKYEVHMLINILEIIPFSNSFIFNEKSPDGNDIFPLRFLYKIDKNNIENLDINIIFNNYNSGFIIELYIIEEDLIDALKKGILIEKFYNDDKIISEELHFLLLKDKIIGKMVDDGKKYFIYIIINKSQNNNKKYDLIESDISINFEYNKIIIPNIPFSDVLRTEEIQLFFNDNSSLEFNTLKNNNNENNTNNTVIESFRQKTLFLHISLESDLDFAIINRTIFDSLDKIDYYKNSTEIEAYNEYSDKIIIYIDILNKNLSDLMINIFSKSNKKSSTNKGYKINYYIGKIFDYPYYVMPDDNKIKYEQKIENNSLTLNINIPNLEKYVYGIYMETLNSTNIIIKIFEIDLNASVDTSKPIIYYELFNNIYSKQILHSNEIIIIEGINVNLYKKQYLIITYANISETNDIISYDSLLIKKANELNEDSNSTIIIVIVLIIIIILFIIVIYILYRKGILRNIFKKKEEEVESDKTIFPLMKIYD